MDNETSSHELLRDEKAAALCDIATRTFRRLVAARKAPQPIKINTLARWRRSELLEWIEGGCLPIEEVPTTDEELCQLCGHTATHLHKVHSHEDGVPLCWECCDRTCVESERAYWRQSDYEKPRPLDERDDEAYG